METRSKIVREEETIVRRGAFTAAVPNRGLAGRRWLRRRTPDVPDGILYMSQGFKSARLNWGRLTRRSFRGGFMELIPFSTRR